MGLNFSVNRTVSEIGSWGTKCHSSYSVMDQVDVNVNVGLDDVNNGDDHRQEKLNSWKYKFRDRNKNRRRRQVRLWSLSRPSLEFSCLCILMFAGGVFLRPSDDIFDKKKKKDLRRWGQIIFSCPWLSGLVVLGRGWGLRSHPAALARILATPRFFYLLVSLCTVSRAKQWISQMQLAMTSRPVLGKWNQPLLQCDDLYRVIYPNKNILLNQFEKV